MSSREATCAGCGGRITYDEGRFEHNWLDTDPPRADLRVPQHDAWPYLHAHQVWRNGRRDSERQRTLEWDAADFKATHPGTRRERALAWLRDTFGGRR